MITKRFATLRLLVLILGIGLISNMSSAPSDAQGQTPIAREGLLRSLSRKVLSSSELVDQVKQRGVDFQLTPADEQEIRRTGKYLRTKGLNSLITAVRNNYRPHVSQKPTPTPS